MITFNHPVRLLWEKIASLILRLCEFASVGPAWGQACEDICGSTFSLADRNMRVITVFFAVQPTAGRTLRQDTHASSQAIMRRCNAREESRRLQKKAVFSRSLSQQTRDCPLVPRANLIVRNLPTGNVPIDALPGNALPASPAPKYCRFRSFTSKAVTMVRCEPPRSFNLSVSSVSDAFQKGTCSAGPHSQHPRVGWPRVVALCSLEPRIP